MTRERARREIDSLDFYLQNHTDDYGEESHTAMMMAIEALNSSENPNRWIPVSERLPEIHQDVILSLRSLDIEVGFRAETEPYFYCYGADGCYIEPQDILAWMPLPEPYKQEVEK